MKSESVNFVKNKILKLDNEKIVHSFTHNYLNIEGLSELQNKIVVIFRPGDFLHQNDIDELLQTAQERNSFYIFLMMHDVDHSNFIKYSGVAKFFFIPSYYHFYSADLPKRQFQKNIIKHFISTNNRIDFARTCLFFYFIRNNLLEKSYFTYLGEERTTTFDECVVDGADFYLNDFDCKNRDKINVETVKKMIPLAIDNPTSVLHFGGDWSVNALLKEYDQSFLSVVVETYSGDCAPYFTEKVWKPIAMKQPFILMNSKHSLKVLRELGFKTFDGVIDETYDNLDNPDRWEAIFREIKRISFFSIGELKEKYTHLEEIIEHNYNHFYNVLPEIYATEIETISRDIDILIQKQLQLLQ